MGFPYCKFNISFFVSALGCVPAVYEQQLLMTLQQYLIFNSTCWWLKGIYLAILAYPRVVTLGRN